MDRFQRLIIRLALRLAPSLRRLFASAGGTVESLGEQLMLYRERYADDRRDRERILNEYAEALTLATAGGPWKTAGVRLQESDGRVTISLTEAQRASLPITLKERIAELELALEDRGWKRQLAIADSEFSRFGIQQIMLISRLYFIKNPLIRRGVQVSAHYVFGRGIEISSTDETANEVLQAFFGDPRNRDVLGQRGLVHLEETTHTDGNLFFAFFTAVDDGATIVRIIDAVEVEEVVTDPDDHAVERFYHRRWMRQNFDEQTGATTPEPQDAWYVALDYDGAIPQTIKGMPVVKDEKTNQPIRVYHVKVGALPKWHFGCPPIYAAIDWARAYRHFLEDWATITRALARFAFNVETQGGPAAIAALKQTLATTLGNDGQSIESNPPPTVASAFITGPGNKLTPVRTTGMTTNPEQGRRVLLMVAAAFGLPETFFGDASTGSLATAQSLDRPTELKFLEAQERWREILQRIGREALARSLGAPKGKLREKFNGRHEDIVIDMAPLASGGIIVKAIEARKPPAPKTETITIEVRFPSILEHDIDKRVTSIVEAMTLNGFEATGLDEKTGIRLLLTELGVEDPEAVLEVMYPQADYAALLNRTEQMQKDKEDAMNPPASPPAAIIPKPGEPQPQGATGAPPLAPKPRIPRGKRVAPSEAAVERAVVELRFALRKLQERGLAHAGQGS